MLYICVIRTYGLGTFRLYIFLTGEFETNSKGKISKNKGGKIKQDPHI